MFDKNPGVIYANICFAYNIEEVQLLRLAIDNVSVSNIYSLLSSMKSSSTITALVTTETLMATKQSAIPLDVNSLQVGEISIRKLAECKAPAEFRLTNSDFNGDTVPHLNFVTSKRGSKTSHVFLARLREGTASVTLMPAQLQRIYQSADGGDWDYVEATWIVGEIDTPAKSNALTLQSGRTFSAFGWPPSR